MTDERPAELERHQVELRTLDEKLRDEILGRFAAAAVTEEEVPAAPTDTTTTESRNALTGAKPSEGEWVERYGGG